MRSNRYAVAAAASVALTAVVAAPAQAWPPPHLVTRCHVLENGVRSCETVGWRPQADGTGTVVTAMWGKATCHPKQVAVWQIEVFAHHRRIGKATLQRQCWGVVAMHVRGPDRIRIKMVTAVNKHSLLGYHAWRPFTIQR